MDNEKQLIGLRKQKLNNLLKMGIDPYPEKSKRTKKIGELFLDKDSLVKSEAEVVVCGRIRALRRQGKIGFGNIEDDSGRIQFYISKADVEDNNYEVFKLSDLGDIVQIRGSMFHTKTGEYTLKCAHFTILCKTMRPLPTVKEKKVDGKTKRYDIFADTELRYRKRYLDLILNPQVKQTFIIRSKIISSFRRILEKKGFLEVETPVLQPLYGGANAKPFTTFYNKLNEKFYLRIATELYLKRLVIGGIERVYEIGKNFRNEGMDKNHNPEFTSLEVYQAYSDLDQMACLTEDLINKTAKSVLGRETLKFQGETISLSAPFKRASMLGLIESFTGENFSDFDFSKCERFCRQQNIEIEKSDGVGSLIAKIFDKFVEHKLIQPTFVFDYPLEISPLAKTKFDNDLLVHRFELFIGGREFANAFSELNDPQEQFRRLSAQAQKRKLGDEEANVLDKDFIEALEYGMPPSGGMGLGMDRLIMLLTANESIKDVLFFPQMRSVSAKNSK